MTDMHKAEAVIDMNSAQYKDDSLKKAMRQSVLMKHGVTQAQFDTTLVWYGHHAKQYDELYDEIVARLEDESREHTIRFDFATQSDNQNGDRYQLSFKFTNSSNNDIEVYLGADYYDGTLSYIHRLSGLEGVNRYVLQGDSTKKIKRVYGYIKANPGDGDVCFIDSLQLLRTRFNSSLYGVFKNQKWVGPHYLDPEYRTLVDANRKKQQAEEAAAEAEEKKQAEIDAQRRVQRRNYRVRPQEDVEADSLG